jgi:hypothetical protein
VGKALSRNTLIIPLLLAFSFGAVHTLRSAQISETQFAVTAKINSVCVVSVDWLLSMIDNRTVPTCADGTPMQIYINPAAAQVTSVAVLAMMTVEGEADTEGKLPCGMMPVGSASRRGGHSDQPIWLNTGGQAGKGRSRLPTISVCF